jgi:hypothetical protein
VIEVRKPKRIPAKDLTKAFRLIKKALQELDIDDVRRLVYLRYNMNHLKDAEQGMENFVKIMRRPECRLLVK